METEIALSPHRCLLAAAATLLPAAANATFVEGYAWPPSVAQGDTVGLHVSTDAAQFDIEVLREGRNSVSYLTVTGVPGVEHAVPDSAWQGCNWPVSYRLAVPASWPSGVYVAKLTAPLANTEHAVFIVKEDVPGSTSRILLQNSTTTWHAYDDYGGKSLYDASSSDNERAHIVSYQRPFARANGLGVFPLWEKFLIQWLEEEGYAVEYCTDLDTHADPTLHANYDLLLIAGHDEYWSWQRRANVEGRIASGGNVAIFGGNTCWWQIRRSPALDQIICYKDPGLDPLTGTADSLVTVHWSDGLIGRPENTLTGASLLHGGNPLGTGGYKVERAGHWAFEGTGLQADDEFGAPHTVGVEVDGCLFTSPGGVPVPTGTDGTPLNFEILATAPASQGTATMGVFQQDSATVFNASTITWALGVANDPVTARVAENVLGHLVDGNPFRSAAGSVVLDDVSWTSAGASVNVNLTFRNTDPANPSRGVHGLVEGRALGDFLAVGAIVGTFDLTSIPPGGTSGAVFSVAKAALPPGAARLLPGGAVSLPGCPEDSSWAGGATVRWRETGVAETTSIWTDTAPLAVCPGAGPSHIQVAWDCADSAGVAWSLPASCAGWSFQLVADAAGVPGGPAPNPATAGTFAGWIAVSADSSLGAGTSCDVDLQLHCAGDRATVIVTAGTCACNDPTGADVSGETTASRLRIHPGEPSPFSGQTIIRYDLPRTATVRLVIHDVSGRVVRRLVEAPKAAGAHAVRWDGRADDGSTAAAGVYFLRVADGRDVVTRKIVRLD